MGKAKRVKIGFDEGTNDSLEIPWYMRDGTYPDAVRDLIEDLVQYTLRPDPTAEFYVDVPVSSHNPTGRGPRLWLDDDPYELAKTWLIKYETNFETAMGGKSLNFRGEFYSMPTVKYIVSKLIA